jgi:hypothetical protein
MGYHDGNPRASKTVRVLVRDAKGSDVRQMRAELERIIRWRTT